METVGKDRIKNITIKNAEGGGKLNDLIVRDRETALIDLKNDSHFKPLNDDNGPYSIELWVEDNRLVFKVSNDTGHDLPILVLSLNPYRRLIKDYFMIMQSYNEALAEGKPSRIEAIDMGRRGLHNEGAELLKERLQDKIDMDFNTARRLFTLICALHSGKIIMWR